MGSNWFPGRWRRLLHGLLVYLGPLVFFEMVGRAYLVWGGLPWNNTLSTYENDELLGYRPNPRFFGGDIRFNALGFRSDREYAAYPAPGTLRVLAVGGSTTFGSGPSARDAFPARLEETAHQYSLPWEVINAGVSGWQLFQIRHSLATWLEQVHPDVVLFNEGWNTGSKPYQYYRNAHLFTYPLFQYSLIFRLIDRRLRAAGVSLHYHPFLETREEVLRKQERVNADTAVFDEYEELVRQCVVLCRQAGVTPVFLLAPGNLPEDLSTSASAYFRGTAQEHHAADYGAMCQAVNRTRDLSAARILKTQAELGFAVIDARQAFEGLDYAARQALFYDEIHPSPAGNTQLARFLCQVLPGQLGLARQ